MTKVNVFLALLVWVSAFVLVSTQYRVRQLTIEINRARDLAYQLENDRTKGALAQSRLSTPLRVESTAREKLGMDLPNGAATTIVDLRTSNTNASASAGTSNANPQVASNGANR